MNDKSEWSPTAMGGSAVGASEYAVTAGTVLWPLIVRRRALTIAIAIGLLGGLLHFLLAPRRYDATASLLPEPQAMSQGWQGVGELASMVGVPFPGSNDATLVYPDVLRSESLLAGVLGDTIGQDAPGRLAEALGYTTSPRDLSRAIRFLRRRIDVSRDQKTAVVRVRVRLNNPQLAWTVADRLVARLDAFYRESRAGLAAANRDFLARQAAEAEASLASAQNVLVSFQTRNRLLADSPELQAEELRLQREVAIRSGLFVELSKQRELAAVSARRNVPVIQMLDSARLPNRRSYPRLTASMLLALGVTLSLALMVIYTDAYLRPYLRREIAAAAARTRT